MTYHSMLQITTPFYKLLAMTVISTDCFFAPFRLIAMTVPLQIPHNGTNY